LQLTVDKDDDICRDLFVQARMGNNAAEKNVTVNTKDNLLQKTAVEDASFVNSCQAVYGALRKNPPKQKICRMSKEK
jgi:hypothetical protein